METPLLLFLVFAMLLVRGSIAQWARWGYLALGVALLLVRFEAAWLLVPFVLLERTTRNRVASATTWFAAFLLQNAVRWWYFGAILPNTIVAKRRFPYTIGTPKEQVEQHLSHLQTMVLTCRFFVLAVVLYLLVRLWTRREWPLGERVKTVWRNCWELRFATVFLCFSVVLTVAIGPNWGPPLRSFYIGWPFLMALVLWPLAWREIRGTGEMLTTTVVAVCLVCMFRVKHEVRDMLLPNAPLYMPNTTVMHVKLVSDALGLIQVASGQKDILFAGPDMGGVQLYSKGVRVLDLGLLCDRTLAREGYGVVETYVFQDRKPDVILVHGMWTSLVKPGESKSFLANYRPVVVNGMRVFLRGELLARIDQKRLTQENFSNGIAVEGGEPSMPEEVDRALNKQFGRYFLLH